MQINLNVLEKVRKISGMERSTRVINSYKLAPYGTVWHRMAPYDTYCKQIEQEVLTQKKKKLLHG